MSENRELYGRAKVPNRKAHSARLRFQKPQNGQENAANNCRKSKQNNKIKHKAIMHAACFEIKQDW